MAAADLTAELPALRPLLARLNDLKRIRTADAPQESLAQRGFARAWNDLLHGDDASAVAEREAASAVASTKLAGIEPHVLARAGLTRDQIGEVFASAVGKAAAPLATAYADRLSYIARHATERRSPGEVPAFVRRLQDQPRAGATHLTERRLILQPAESHADHSYVVAASGALLAGHVGADATVPFLAGLAHHLHNAVLPDAGFAGEQALGRHLDAIVKHLSDQVLDQMPPGLAQRIRDAVRATTLPVTPEGESFHAADVIDRVLEAEYFDRVARFRLSYALDTLELVHESPLKPFQQRVLSAVELAP